MALKLQDICLEIITKNFIEILKNGSPLNFGIYTDKLFQNLYKNSEGYEWLRIFQKPGSSSPSHFFLNLKTCIPNHFPSLLQNFPKDNLKYADFLLHSSFFHFDHLNNLSKIISSFISDSKILQILSFDVHDFSDVIFVKLIFDHLCQSQKLLPLKQIFYFNHSNSTNDFNSYKV